MSILCVKVSLEQVTVSLDDTLILHGGGDKKQIEERCEEVIITLNRVLHMSSKIYPIAHTEPKG